jgi:hypothetical protein
VETELKLFEPLKEEYQIRQKTLFGLDPADRESKICTFPCRVRVYIFALLLLAICGDGLHLAERKARLPCVRRFGNSVVANHERRRAGALHPSAWWRVQTCIPSHC